MCTYHPGCPVFHEGLKFWSCCQRRTTDFNTFLSQPGCTTGTHKWTKEVGLSLFDQLMQWLGVLNHVASVVTHHYLVHYVVYPRLQKNCTQTWLWWPSSLSASPTTLYTFSCFSETKQLSGGHDPRPLPDVTEPKLFLPAFLFSAACHPNAFPNKIGV